MAVQDNINTIYSFLSKHGLSAEDTAAIMGNMSVETGGSFDPTSWNKGENAIGISQWELGRRTALQNYAATKGTKETDLITQLEYLWQEAGQRGNLAGIRRYTDVNQAAQYWDQSFEVSAGTTDTQRQQAASHILAEIQSGKGIKQVPINGGAATPKAPFDSKTLIPPVSDAMFAKVAKWFSDGISIPGVPGVKKFEVSRTQNKASGPGTRFNPQQPVLERWTYTIKDENSSNVLTYHDDISFISAVLGYASGALEHQPGGGEVIQPGIPNPLQPMFNAARDAANSMAAIGTFFEKLGWIFSLDHFIKFLLYLGGFWAMAIGLGLITFGGKSSEAEE